MFLVGHELDYRDAKQKEQKNLLAQPRGIEIRRTLNGISTCTLSYSPTVEVLALDGEAEEFLYPFEMRLSAEFAPSFKPDDTKTRNRFFSGYLESMSITRGRGTGLVLRYADPLVTLKERDDPKIWQGSKRHTLKDVFDDLMSNSFDRAGGQGGTKKMLKSKFDDAPPELGAGLMNVDQLDFDFIRQTSEYFGFHFHFEHEFESSSELRVRFKRAKFDKTPNIEAVDQSHFAGGFTFTAGVTGFFDRVEVEYGGGRATASMKDLESTMSPAFKPKLKARDAAGYELIYNDHRPTLTTGEAQAYAEGLLMRAALTQGDTLIFDSATVLPLGELIDVRKNQNYKPELPTRVLGRYLVSEVTNTYDGRGWMHHYKAVRP